jgi:SLBB domain
MRRALIIAVVVSALFSSGSRVSPASSESHIRTDAPSIYVSGAVQNPGRYDWFKGMNICDAVQAAGGLSESFAVPVIVTVVHSDRTGVTFAFLPDAGAANMAFKLKEFDTVYVARTLTKSPLAPLEPKPAN